MAALGALKRGVARGMGLSAGTVLRVSREEFRPVRGRPPEPDALRARLAVLLPGLKDRLRRDLVSSSDEVQDRRDACDAAEHDNGDGADIV